LVKVWGAENPVESVLAFLPAAGWKVNINMRSGPVGTAVFEQPVNPHGWSYGASWMRKLYTPSSEIAATLRQSLDDGIKQRQHDEVPNSLYDVKVRPGSLQPRLIGGNQALSCIVDYMQRQGDHNEKLSEYLDSDRKHLHQIHY